MGIGGSSSPPGLPVGSIIPWIGGYFDSANNTNYARVLGTANTVAAVNIYVNSLGWYVCDGSALNDANSPIFNAANRFLPNLTDKRFFMGDTTCGTAGGNNSTTIASANLPTHTHTINHNHASFTTPVGGGTHTHTITHDWAKKQSFSVTLGGGVGISYWGTADIVINNTGSTHKHNVNVPSYSGSSGNGGFSNNTIENRPTYLSCFYIMKVR